MPWRVAVARALAVGARSRNRDAFLHAEIHHEPCSWDPWLGRGRWRLAEPCGGAKAWRRGRSTQTFPHGVRGGPGFRQPLQDGAIIRSQVPCGGAKAAHSSRVFSRHLCRSIAWRAARNNSGCLGPKTRARCSEESPNLHTAAATCSTSSCPEANMSKVNSSKMIVPRDHRSIG